MDWGRPVILVALTSFLGGVAVALIWSRWSLDRRRGGRLL